MQTRKLGNSNLAVSASSFAVPKAMGWVAWASFSYGLPKDIQEMSNLL